MDTHSNSKPTTNYEVTITIEDCVKKLLELNNNEITANLWLLQHKHPELFKKPSDVYRLIIEVKEHPTMFFTNNRADINLMAKVLRDGSLGKVGVVKEGENMGKVAHATYSTRKNELDRLASRSKNLAVGSPYSTLLSSNNLVETARGDNKSLSLDSKPDNTSKDIVSKNGTDSATNSKFKPKKTQTKFNDFDKSM